MARAFIRHGPADQAIRDWIHVAVDGPVEPRHDE
jgi:hypothetical protein